MMGQRRLRSFSTGTKLARAIPSRSVIEVRVQTYLSPEQSWNYSIAGLPEERYHHDGAMSGHVRAVRLLERDSHRVLWALMNGHEDIAAAKDRILWNEIACRHLYRASVDLVETLDQFRVQEVAKAMPVDYDSLFPGIGRSATTILEDQIKARGTNEQVRYQQLLQLAEKFESIRVPVYAAYLALNIPLPDRQESPEARTAALTDINFDERFNEMYSVLMDVDEEADSLVPTATDMIWHEEVASYVPTRKAMKRLRAFFNRVMGKLDFETAFPEDRAPLPLLDTPVRHTPSRPEIVDDLLCEEVYAQPFVIQELLVDAATLFNSVGCVILCRDDWRPFGYIPNVYVVSEPVHSWIYFNYLMDALAATGVIDQLVGRSLANAPTRLECPLCRENHDPRHGNCAWDAFLDSSLIAQAHSDQWHDYMGEIAPILEEFVSVDVPGEDALRDFQTARQLAG